MLKSTSTVLLVFCAVLTSSLVFAAYPPVPSAPIVAHRGFSSAAPENTLSAFKKAIESGAQGCEMDIHSTKDGVIVVSHDVSTKRATGVDLLIAETNFSELRKLDFSMSSKSWGDQYRGESIATFEDALKLLKGTSCRPVIEVKADGFESEVVRIVRKYGLEKTAVIIDFSAKRVKKFRELAPEICCAWLCSYDRNKVAQSKVADIVLKQLAECGTNVVDIHFGNVDQEFLDKMKKAGVHVWVWTVNNPAVMQKFIDWKVEAITTDCPDKALELLKK